MALVDQSSNRRSGRTPRPSPSRQRRGGSCGLTCSAAGGEMQEHLGLRQTSRYAAGRAANAAQQLRALAQPPGSRVTTTSRRTLPGNAAARWRRACVDLPAPSPPSNVMNRPRAANPASLAAGDEMRRARPARRPGRPRRGTSAPASSVTLHVGHPLPAHAPACRARIAAADRRAAMGASRRLNFDTFAVVTPVASAW